MPIRKPFPVNNNEVTRITMDNFLKNNTTTSKIDEDLLAYDSGENNTPYTPKIGKYLIAYNTRGNKLFKIKSVDPTSNTNYNTVSDTVRTHFNVKIQDMANATQIIPAVITVRGKAKKPFTIELNPSSNHTLNRVADLYYIYDPNIQKGGTRKQYRKKHNHKRKSKQTRRR
jgi:hypothetical protein